VQLRNGPAFDATDWYRMTPTARGSGATRDLGAAAWRAARRCRPRRRGRSQRRLDKQEEIAERAMRWLRLEEERKCEEWALQLQLP
jgi:hypothetical protein